MAEEKTIKEVVANFRSVFGKDFEYKATSNDGLVHQSKGWVEVVPAKFECNADFMDLTK